MAWESRGAFPLVLAVLILQPLVPTFGAPTAAGQSSPEPYHNYETLREDVQQLVREHSDVAHYRVIGSSETGLQIFAVDVAPAQTERGTEALDDLPTLYVDGGHHGNELLSIEAAYHFLKNTLERIEEDPSYLEGKRLVVTPVVNPDGYVRDYRTNAEQVDLNRNYPYHWSLYGTSEVPGHPNYHGPAPASEPETQATIELMKDMNTFAYLSGHTGTYDVVLPWDEDEDGEIPDWPLYETTLDHVQEETGLEYRDPSGAGESTAYGYGNRTAMSLVVEVSEEQFVPVSTESVEQRLQEVLQVYRLTWENLTHVGGELHVRDTDGATVTVHNDGWGPAYDVRAGASSVPEIAPGETVTMERSEGEECVVYERIRIEGDDPSLGLRATPIPTDEGKPTCDPEPVRQAPGPGLAALVVALAGAAAILARRPRG